MPTTDKPTIGSYLNEILKLATPAPTLPWEAQPSVNFPKFMDLIASEARRALELVFKPVDIEIIKGADGRALLKTPGLWFCITNSSAASWVSEPYGVYMTHGTPGGAFWKNAAPLRSFKTREDANEFIDTLAGRKDAHKAFASNFYTA